MKISSYFIFRLEKSKTISIDRCTEVDDEVAVQEELPPNVDNTASKDFKIPMSRSDRSSPIPIESPNSSSGDSGSCSCSTSSCDESCPADCDKKFVCCFEKSCDLEAVPLGNCKNGFICCDRESCDSDSVELDVCPNQDDSDRKSCRRMGLQIHKLKAIPKMRFTSHLKVNSTLNANRMMHVPKNSHLYENLRLKKETTRKGFRGW